MNRLFLTMAAISALSAGAPAAAQYRGGNFQGPIQRLELQLQAAVRSGSISRREAIPLREQLRQLRLLERRYGADGLSRRETADLDQRTRYLRQRIRYAERAADGRYDRNRDGFDDRYDRNADGRDDRYDRNADGDDDRFDRNNDGRDDRYDRNRDGADDRFDRNNDGRDDRYELRGGLDAGATIGIGQPVPPGLGPVPAEYRGRYRDGDGSYFRSDGRAIYQVDARTNNVVRIYPIGR